MPKPPLVATLLLGWVLHPVDRDIVLGDLEELYVERLKNSGKLKAAGWYWSQVLRSVFPLLLRSLDWYIVMFFHYMKIGLRSLRKQAGYAITNLTGLSVGLACVLLIALFVRFELSYDRFHTSSDRLYRIIKEDPNTNFLGNNRFAVTPAPLVTALPDEFPEVEYATQLFGANRLLQHQHVQLFADGMYATPDFFKVFTFPLASGDASGALDAPNSIVLTESLAEQFFKGDNPVGQTISVRQGKDFIEMSITGVAEDPPSNSHLAFSYIISANSTRNYTRYVDNWDSNNYLTYVTLKPGQSLDAFTTKLSQLARKYLSQYAYYQERPEDITTYKAQPVVDIHLHSDVNFEFGRNGDMRYVYLFSVIAILILLIACINYINLATARSFTRTTEVGVRQVLGARRPQLIGQFVGESVLPAILALCIALLLVQLVLPVFNSLLGRDITLSLFNEPGLLLLFVAVGIAVGLLAGSYPALSLTQVKTVQIIRGVIGGVRNKARLRNALVVLQFTISIALLISALVIRNQIEFTRSQQTGVDRDQVISVLVRDKEVFKSFATLKETLLQDSKILAVTAAGHDPTNIYASSGTDTWDGAQEGQQVSIFNSPVQPGYVEALGIDLVEGEGMSPNAPEGGPEQILINETLRRQLGWESALGKHITLNGREGQVVGVMKDFNFQSFHQPIGPLLIYPDSYWVSRVLVKVRPEQMQETIASLEATFSSLSDVFPFEYTFLDDAYENMYQSEKQFGSIVGYFTGLALIIACLGLMGVAAFTVEQRTKEIGVRKVLGASLHQVLALLSRDFLLLVGIALVLAAPIAYYAMHIWLEDFAYRITPGISTLAVAGGLTLILSMGIVLYQSLRVANLNPVDSLRSD